MTPSREEIQANIDALTAQLNETPAASTDQAQPGPVPAYEQGAAQPPVDELGTPEDPTASVTSSSSSQNDGELLGGDGTPKLYRVRFEDRIGLGRLTVGAGGELRFTELQPEGGQ